MLKQRRSAYAGMVRVSSLLVAAATLAPAHAQQTPAPGTGSPAAVSAQDVHSRAVLGPVPAPVTSLPPRQLTLPGCPSICLTVLGLTSARIDWAATPTAVSYSVRRSGGGAVDKDVGDVPAGAALTLTDTTLRDNSTYSYYVRAIGAPTTNCMLNDPTKCVTNSAPLAGQTPTATLTTPALQPPGGVSVTVNPNNPAAVAINWLPTVAGASYGVYRDGGPIATVPGPPVNDTVGVPGVYHYQIATVLPESGGLGTSPLSGAVGVSTPPLGNFGCWVDKNPASPNFVGNLLATDVSFVVRSFNARDETPDANFGPQGTRIVPLAQNYAMDWPYPASAGLIALQELVNTDCAGFPDQPHDACVARLWERSLGLPVNSFQSSNTPDAWDRIGIVVGWPWQLIEPPAGFLLGKDVGTNIIAKLFDAGESRYMVEAHVRHRVTGQTLRFYTVHLSHPSANLGLADQATRRHAEIATLIQVIDSRVAAGELPPIVAGDMNYVPHLAAGQIDDRFDPDSYALFSQAFYMANEDAVGCRADGSPAVIVGMDQVWIGRKAHYQQTAGGFQTLRFHLPPPPGNDQGVGWGLSDHASPGVSLRIVPTAAR